MNKTKSSLEQYAEKYLKKRGYEVELVKQWQSKTKYRITKDNFTYEFDLPCAVVDKKKYMDIVNENFEMNYKYRRLNV